MRPYFKGKFGNASEPHSWGQETRKAVEKAREQAASSLGAKAKEIIFTSCATESINLAHKGVLEAFLKNGEREKREGILHLVTSAIEHKAGIETARHLEKKGYKVTFLPVDKYGMVKATDVKKAIRPTTILVSIMYVNNEVGTIEPIDEIGETISQINKLRVSNGKEKIFFHTDATQAIQYLNCNVGKLGVDLLSLTGHKFYAPKGIGVLYVREGTPIIRQQDGGGQEFGLRSGTENVPYIVGLGKAFELTDRNKEKNAERIGKLRKKLVEGVLKIPNVQFTGRLAQSAPHIASFIIKGAEGEAMLLHLDAVGIAASSGSACTSGLLEPSHVLTAMGISPELAHGSLRFSLGKQTTKEEIDYVIKVLPGIVEKLRKMAPNM
jgi:cysteine desulfurase